MRTLFFFFITLLTFTACNKKASSTDATTAKSEAMPVAVTTPQDLSKYSKAYLASGCFWCVEGAFESVKGVAEVVSGYSGGTKENPTYEEVGAGRTGHAEAVEVYYDAAQINYETLLKVYFNSMDPTQVNGQGPDNGSAYRSIILYQNEQEKQSAESAIKALTDSKNIVSRLQWK